MNALFATLPRRVLMKSVRAYQVLLSPWLAGTCRFEPTCSAYSMQALERHGALAGTYLTLGRIARCQPFCEGGHDPVPDRLQSPFSRLLREHRAHNAAPSHPLIDKTSK